jgi:hypothetical protein
MHTALDPRNKEMGPVHQLAKGSAHQIFLHMANHNSPAHMLQNGLLNWLIKCYTGILMQCASPSIFMEDYHVLTFCLYVSIPMLIIHNMYNRYHLLFNIHAEIENKNGRAY